MLGSGGITVNKISALMELRFGLGKPGTFCLFAMKAEWKSPKIKQGTWSTLGAEESLLIAEMFKQIHKTNNCWKGIGKRILGAACADAYR